jgi:hypothetical protein
MKLFIMQFPPPSYTVSKIIVLYSLTFSGLDTTKEDNNGEHSILQPTR